MGALLLAGVALAPADAAAQKATEAQADQLKEWALRGVVITDGGSSAVLEHVPSGRDALVKAGTQVSPRVAVVAIDHDRVILRGDDDATVTLRLGHGGPAVRPPAGRPPVVRSRVVPGRRPLPSTIGRRYR
jgi:hypothetical protein